jgi:hypothetical protein
MIAIVNHTGSGRVLRLFRLWLINTASAAVTGGTCVSQLDRCTSVASFTAGTALTFLKHDSNSETPPATVLANTGTTTVLTRSGTYRNIMSYNEEIVLSTGHPEDLMTLVPFGLVWDAGYGNSTIQPITMREGEGVVLYTPSSGGGTYAGNVDICAELTLAVS